MDLATGGGPWDAVGVLSAAAAVSSGLVAGIFFAFSVFVMRALGAVPPESGVAAMRSINRVIITPLFIAVFLGAGALGVALAVLGPWPHAVAAALYVVGVFGVTGARNVPWNNELDALTPGTAEAAAYWAGYLRRWTAWNHVRTVASTGATVLYVIT
ncbi:putative membrane protein [Actinokineospora auranticolor]|uniref:Putative membrane protein n=1 Tax=Actinokineospora auranticolor TaxID=155976 RepID=A0A2S6GMJ8_9PSEU|nr:putative membrane protein [Actinokineospora auranticolor]